MPNVRIASTTREILGRDDGTGTPPPGYERAMISDFEYQRLVDAAPFQVAHLGTDGVVNITPLPPPTHRLETTPEMRAKWQAALDQIEIAAAAYNTASDAYAAARPALPVAVRTATDALGQMIGAVRDGAAATQQQVKLLAQATRLEDPTLIPVEPPP